jgi:methionyl-tRNA formyltransferase
MTAGSAPGRAAGRARTIFFGSGSFAVPILEAVAAHPRLELVAVVTVPDRPAGRGSTLRPTPVALRARAMWVPLLQPARIRAPEAIAELGGLRPELGVLADYGQIIPGALIDMPRLGILNVHPSLLPRHRGATPIQAAIAEGDSRTGVTIIRMDERVDTGPIVATTDWSLAGTERAPDLEAFAAREGAALLEREIAGWLDGSSAARPQPDLGASLTRTLRREDGRLDPTRPAAELERHVRAYVPWPGSFLETDAGRLGVQVASTAPAASDDAPGTLVGHDDRLALATAAGRLVLEQVQLAGKRPMAGDEFLRGQPGLVGTSVASGARARSSKPAERQPVESRR